MDTITRTYEAGDTVALNFWDGPRDYTIPADAIAVMHESDGSIADVALNRETAESMLLEGYVAVPVGEANRELYGDAFAHLRELWLDCWT